MNKLTAVMPFSLQSGFEKTLRVFIQSPLIEEVIVLHESAFEPPWPRCKVMRASSLFSGQVLNNLIEKIRTDFLMIMTEPAKMEIPPATLERFLNIAESTDSGMVYSDYLDEEECRLVEHPVNDYQLGSIRDGFDFGYVVLISISAIRHALKKYGPIPSVVHAWFYDLRLKVSVDHGLFH
ncbi:MAG TPA: glycosyltransferase family 2 protein, partial [Syntrophales bacterium]